MAVIRLRNDPAGGMRINTNSSFVFIRMPSGIYGRRFFIHTQDERAIYAVTFVAQGATAAPESLAMRQG